MPKSRTFTTTKASVSDSASSAANSNSAARDGSRLPLRVSSGHPAPSAAKPKSLAPSLTLSRPSHVRPSSFPSSGGQPSPLASKTLFGTPAASPADLSAAATVPFPGMNLLPLAFNRRGLASPLFPATSDGAGQVHPSGFSAVPSPVLAEAPTELLSPPSSAAAPLLSHAFQAANQMASAEAQLFISNLNSQPPGQPLQPPFPDQQQPSCWL